MNPPSRSSRILLTMGLAAAAIVPQAFAHSGNVGGAGFVSGFAHPIQGWDHVAAMVAVGLWGAILKSPGIWILPVAFPLVMAVGCALGVIGVPLPGVEVGIALSSVVLGLLIVTAYKAPVWAAVTIVSVFAIFHGYAHGTELPGSANPAAFASGFVIATGLLHLAGIGIGLVTKLRYGDIVLKVAGTCIVLVGVGFLTGAF